MELFLASSSSPRFSSPHQAKLTVKPTGKFKSISYKWSQILPSTNLSNDKSYLSLFCKNDNCSKLALETSCGRKGIPLIRANSQVDGDKFADSTFEKILNFSKLVATQFLRGMIIRGTFIALTGTAARIWLENANQLKLLKWSLLLKTLAALVAQVCMDGYIGGVNQIFDVDIDKINKPFFPLASGKLSIRSAWLLLISFVATSFSMAGLLNSRWLLAFLCYQLFLGWIYSAPPIRLKQSTIGAIFANASGRGFAFTFTMAAAARAILGLPFQFSPSLTFISIFATLVFIAMAILKDISDLEGDIKYNVPTVASIIGARNAAFLGIGILLLAYIGAIFAAVCMPQVFRRSVMIPAHALLASCLIFRAWKFDQANYGKEESAAFYASMFILFDIEFIIFPFV